MLVNSMLKYKHYTKQHNKISILQEKMPLFYDRLHEALQILSDYFLSDGRGLEPERLYNDCYRDLDVIFGLAKMSTDQLIAE